MTARASKATVGVYDYYLIRVPGDMADTLEELGHQAIREAEERVKLQAIPCAWRATHVSGDVGDFEVTFRVIRFRHRRAPTPGPVA